MSGTGGVESGNASAGVIGMPERPSRPGPETPATPKPAPDVDAPPRSPEDGRDALRDAFPDTPPIEDDADADADADADRAETDTPGGGAGDPAAGTTDPGQPFRRLLPSDYADGASAPSGADRPDARTISNAVAAETGAPAPEGGPSDLFWMYGQFLDHDLDLTQSAERGAGEALPIAIPTGDPTFDPDGTGEETLPFTRSLGVAGADGRRQHVNTITALIDGSNVYGSTPEETASLRAFENGKLAMGVVDGSGYDELPRDDDSRFYRAGDARANENAGLLAMHTLFAREHNRVAEEIAAADPTLDDEAIFQQARATVTAQLQAITYNEFLPILLGDAAPEPHGAFTGVDAQISNSFATAAFRFGHSMVSDTLLLQYEDGKERQVPLFEAFFQPDLKATEGIDPVLRGGATQAARPLDTEIVDSLRNLVLNAPTSPRLDLAALNIQRGRDHGLPSLNDAREGLGLDRLTGFDDPRLREGAGDRLAAAYDSIDDVDLWVGLLSEKPVAGGLAGEAQAAILIDQFTRLRDGDPDWYARCFDAETVADLDALRLSDIIARNSGVTEIDRTALVAE